MSNTEPLVHEKPLISNRKFNYLRRFNELVLPALAAFYVAIAQIFDLPYAPQVTATAVAVGTLAGVVLLWLRNQYDNSVAKYDGEVVVNQQDAMKDTFRLEIPDPVNHIATSDELRLRVRHEE